MKSRALNKRGSLLLVVLIFVFLVYFSGIIYFSFTVETIALFNAISKSRLLALAIIFLLAIMLFLVLFNIIRIVIDRKRNKEGTRFRIRLALFFLIIASIPLIPLSVVSNNWISKSINLLFISGLDTALQNAVEISKKYYEKLSLETLKDVVVNVTESRRCGG